MTNKKLGNNFERELCAYLSEHGYWTHNFTQNQHGQPADVIAVKNGKPYLIDCKVCSTEKGFDLRRVEENQALAMTLWNKCGNGIGWFAIRTGSDVHMLSHPLVKSFMAQQSWMSFGDICKYGVPLDEWITI